MGCHLFNSLILRAIVKCTVFSGAPSLKGEEYIYKIFYEPVKIILDLVEKRLNYYSL